MRRVGQLVGGLAVLLLPASRTLAQTAATYSLQGSGIFVIPGGTAFADTKSGPGVELQLRRRLPWSSGLWSIGGGVQYSRHDVGAANPLTLTGVFLEPRRVFEGSSSRFAAYGSLRAAVFQQSLSAEGTSSSATGGQLNVGGGVLIVASSSINIDLGATFGLLKFGGYNVPFVVGGGFPVPASSGSNLVLRAGLAIGLGAK